MKLKNLNLTLLHRDRVRQIERVVRAQGLNYDDAADQVRGRIYEARRYLVARAGRNA